MLCTNVLEEGRKRVITLTAQMVARKRQKNAKAYKSEGNIPLFPLGAKFMDISRYSHAEVTKLRRVTPFTTVYRQR